MATQEDQVAFVERAAVLFAEAENKGGEFYNSILALVPLMREGRALGIAGYLQSQRMKNDIRSASGDAARGLATVFAVHAEGTVRAQALGIDLPQPLDGGGNR